MIDQRARYLELAAQASELVAEAYALAVEDPNPYASMVVTQVLADGDLILLSTARRLNEGKG